jgi:hypothetical protein
VILTNGHELCLEFYLLIRKLPLNHERLSNTSNHEQGHEQEPRTVTNKVTTKSPTNLITSVKGITPLASPHEQQPSMEC